MMHASLIRLRRWERWLDDDKRDRMRRFGLIGKHYGRHNSRLLTLAYCLVVARGLYNESML